MPRSGKLFQFFQITMCNLPQRSTPASVRPAAAIRWGPGSGQAPLLSIAAQRHAHPAFAAGKGLSVILYL